MEEENFVETVAQILNDDVLNFRGSSNAKREAICEHLFHFVFDLDVRTHMGMKIMGKISNRLDELQARQY